MPLYQAQRLAEDDEIEEQHEEGGGPQDESHPTGVHQAAHDLRIIRQELSALLNVEPEAADASITAAFEEAGVEVVPITDDVARAAVAAFARYGKGRGHPARLNLADCLIYAAAKAAGAPLLFIGDGLQPRRYCERARRSAPNPGVTIARISG
jgi:uncharacterized protein with PIN domain